jgi:hypothetical protein
MNTMNTKIFMSHDLYCALGELGGAACLHANMPAVQSHDRSRQQLAIAAIAFTIQLAIEAGRDPAEMRALERDLIAAVTG